jgi:2-C-methyl-D-erythritol 2,4-cyclodiphosphate synthase
MLSPFFIEYCKSQRTFNEKPETRNDNSQPDSNDQLSTTTPTFAQIQNMSFRIGFGVDFHQLGEGRKLMIGGVRIPHTKGCIGHSDADVLLHAICDAMLGAACLGDIGVHFPDTDNKYKNIDSKILLKETSDLITNAGYSLVNIDSSVCLQEPKIKPFVLQMQQTIAKILSVKENEISIKATTTERMGFVGREEGVVAYATVLLQAI